MQTTNRSLDTTNQNMVNISQSCEAMHSRCGEIFNDDYYKFTNTCTVARMQ